MTEEEEKQLRAKRKAWLSTIATDEAYSVANFHDQINLLCSVICALDLKKGDGGYEQQVKLKDVYVKIEKVRKRYADLKKWIETADIDKVQSFRADNFNEYP